jgi:4-hydroxybenzoate polyprenyltransferase
MVIRPINVLLTIAMQYALYYILYENSPSEKAEINDSNIHLLAGLSFACIAAGFVINDYYDRETDLINRPKKSNKLASVSDNFLLTLYAILSIAGAICGFIFGSIAGNQVLLFLYILATVLLWWYSKTLKSVPLWGNLVVAIFCASVIFIFPIMDFPYLSSIETQGVRVSNIFIGYSIFAFMITFIREITKDVEDKTGDERSGLQTLATRLAPERIKKLLLVLYFLYLFFGIYAFIWIGQKMNWPAFISAALLGPPSLLTGWYLLNLEKERSPKLASRYLKITMILSLVFILTL